MKAVTKWDLRWGHNLIVVAVRLTYGVGLSLE